MSMKMKLRAPLMIQQVQQLMENSRFDGPLEFHHYWDGYISALCDTGMITDKGETALREFAEEINGACMYEAEDEPAVDPEALMQKLAQQFPVILTGERSEANHAGDVKPVAVTTEPEPPIVMTNTRRSVRR